MGAYKFDPAEPDANVGPDEMAATGAGHVIVLFAVGTALDNRRAPVVGSRLIASRDRCFRELAPRPVTQGGPQRSDDPRRAFRCLG
jgi:hypothetical protein